jgi:hypothetical protein
MVGFGGLVAMAFVTLQPGAADAAGADQHPLLRAALECRTISDEGARLACFDQAVAGLGEAATRGNLIVADRRETQRSMFGFSLPGIFAGDDAPREIQAVVASAREVGYHNWLIHLEGGGSWQTTENSSRQELPRAGQQVTLTRAFLGNYWISVNGGRQLRVRRVR